VKNIFTEHPKSVGETYTEHMSLAFRFAITFLLLFFIAFIHAILPFLFKRTASDIVREMNEDMKGRNTDE
tara:strand:- start:441 stop:650 length:210 start_codon:yes stop_codon:yes gene_type:complete